MKAFVILIAVVLIAIVFGILIAKFYKPYQAVKEEAEKHQTSR
jgi:Na+/H+-dicarboxylate symporter